MLLYLHLALSFIVGGVFIAMQTLFAERMQGIWRGIALTIPSTMAMGFFFIGLTKTASDVAEVARIFPAVLAADYLFVLAFAVCARFNLFAGLAGGFALWGLASLGILAAPPQNFFIALALYAAFPITISFLTVRTLPQVHELKVFPMNTRHIFLRAILGGSVVASAVVLSKTLGNVWGGLFSGFPAVFTSMFIVYYHLQGKRVIPSVAKSVFFPGVIGMMLYAWIAALTFPIYGIWLGTLASYVATFLFYWLYSSIQTRVLNF